ncbi:MAG: PDZ domain-containing protein [Bdellovibrionaceae bacterium]|nr:PDZ domain-containing protein [Pseudobdellovibrionaceae bacterium]
MRTLILILLFIAVPLAGGSLKPESESSYWRDSGIDLSLVKAVINDRDCSSGERYFESCRKALIEAAKAMKQSTRKELVVLQKATFRDKFQFERLLANLLKQKSQMPAEMVYAKMINAQLGVFDPYARLIPAAFSDLLLNGENKTYYGIGIESEATGAGLFIFKVFPNTPAAHAGLKVHDRIVSVNGRSAQKLSEAHALANRLGGKEGEFITLEIERAGARIEPVTLQVSAVAVIENPQAEVLVDGNRYLQIRLRSFGRGTCSGLSRKIQNALSNDEAPLRGLVLDLRHNSGGLVDEGECVARLFLGQKPVVSRESLRFEFSARPGFLSWGLPDNSGKKAGWSCG